VPSAPSVRTIPLDVLEGVPEDGVPRHLQVLGLPRVGELNLVTIGAILGGSVRVGLEDSIYLVKGVLAESNADQVAKIVRILGELSLEIATPDEARQMLALKGAAQTAIPEAVAS
jgi:uncharacterized protein (DUF849 family)